MQVCMLLQGLTPVLFALLELSQTVAILPAHCVRRGHLTLKMAQLNASHAPLVPMLT